MSRDPAGSGRRPSGHARRAGLAVGAFGALALAAPAVAAFPGGNGTIVFTSNRVVGDEPALAADPSKPVTDFDIYAVDPSGTAVPLTTNTAIQATENGVASLTPIDDVAPAVSPDGRRVAFTRNYDPNDGSTDPDLYVMDIDGGNVVQLTSDKPGGGKHGLNAADYEPAWSPDGTRIAWRKNDGRNADIWILDLTTGSATNVTESLPATGSSGPHFYQGEPAWSPDGTKIAFRNGQGRFADVKVLDLATVSAALVAAEPEVSEGSPSWSPDGRLLAYRRGDDGAGAGIWTVDVETGARTMLTDPLGGAAPPPEGSAPTTYSDLMPAWSPDGSSIAFQSTRPDEGEGVAGDPDLYVMKADGTGQTRLDASAIATEPPTPLTALAIVAAAEEGGGMGGGMGGGDSAPPLPQSDLTPDWQTIASSDLRLTLADRPDPVVAGETVAYTVTVANPGPSFAAGVVVTMPVPVGASLVSATASQGSCSGGAVVTCALGGIAVGRSATVTVTVRAEKEGVLSASASVTSTTPDPVAADNAATESTRVDAAPAPVVAPTRVTACVAPRLKVRLVSQSRVRAGRRVPVQIRVTNTSRVAAGGVVVDYRPPAGFVVAGTSRTHRHVGASLRFRWSSVSAKGTVRVKLMLRPRTGVRVTSHSIRVSTTCAPAPKVVRSGLRVTAR